MEDEVRQQKINQLVSSYISHDTASSSIQKCSEMENVEQGILTPLVIPSDTEKRDNRKLLPCTRPREMKSSNVMVLRNAVKKKVKTKKFVQEELSKLHLKQLRIAVVDALGIHGIHLENPLFKTCAKKLFVICQTFAKVCVKQNNYF